jgi:hypothetical protein
VALMLGQCQYACYIVVFGRFLLLGEVANDMAAGRISVRLCIKGSIRTRDIQPGLHSPSHNT